MKNKTLKVVIIGGGSSYTPELMEGLIHRYVQFPIREIWLVDVEEGKEKVEIIKALAKRMWKAKNINVEIFATVDRKKALKDANFVITQFRVGSMKARIKDERIPLSYQMIGQETCGAGGIFKALRTIPVILDIVEEMKESCPNSWLINFTNPSGIITEAIIRYGQWKRVIGLCNIPIGMMKAESKQLGKEGNELIFQFAGLNHFHWHKVFDDGQDVTSKLIQNSYRPSNIAEIRYFHEQLESIKMIPCSYHQYYYMQEDSLNHLIEEYNTIGTRGEQVLKEERELFELYKNPLLCFKPDQLSKRGGAYYSDSACEIMVSIYNNLKQVMVVNTLNNGAISGLPSDCVVEVSAIIHSNGANALTFGTFDYAQKGWLQLMKNFELCVCEAGFSGDYGLVLQAFQMNPLITSGTKAKRVMDELFVAHKEYLPQFKEKIIQLENIQIKDEIARKL